MRTWIALFCFGCGEEMTVSVLAFDVPNLRGEVVVREGDAEVSRVGLEVDGARAFGRADELGSGRDLTAQISWYSTDLSVAETARLPFRTEKRKPSVLEVGEYDYPDADGDGAANLVEVISSAAHPEQGAAATDPAVAPAGFYSDFVRTFAFGGIVEGGTFSRSNRMVFAVTDGTNVSIYGVSLDNREVFVATANELDVEFITDTEASVSSGRIAMAGSTHSGTSVLLVFQADDLFQEDAMALIHAFELPGQQSEIVFSSDGGVLFVPIPEKSEIIVFNLRQPIPVVEERVEAFNSAAAVQVGERLVSADIINDRLLILEEGSKGWRGSAYALEGEVFRPSELQVHPAAPRLYVLSQEGELIVVDVASEDPGDWRIVDRIEGVPEAGEMTIDPLFGAWLYIRTTEELVRVDTLLGEVTATWPADPSLLDAWLDFFIADDGLGAVVDGSGILLMGHRASGDREPNEAPPALGEGNRIAGGPAGPFPAVVAGRVASAEIGQISTVSMFIDDPDMEDLFLIDLPLAGRAAIGLFSNGLGHTSLGLFDASGSTELGRALGVASDEAWNVGQMLVSPMEAMGTTAIVGIDGRPDLTLDQTVLNYEIVAVDLTGAPSVPEFEPNDNAAQRILVVPVVITGAAVRSDRDCFVLAVGRRRVGVRLDMASGTDLDLARFPSVPFAGGLTPNGVSFAGVAEFYIFDPLRLRETEQTFCVINSSNVALNAGYELTIADFTIPYR